MKKALEKLSSSGNARIIDVDDPDIILNDVIEELLEKRQIIEDIKNTAQSWLPKLARR
jgi:vacuolar-type H+-ATPase subunit I/STV1